MTSEFNFSEDQRGATMVEYAIAVALLVVSLALVINLLQGSVKGRVEKGKTMYETYDIPDPAS